MSKPNIELQRKIKLQLHHGYERYLPTAFDESLSILEKINKVIEQLNKNGEATNSLINQWNDVVEWILNDGLESTLSDKIDALVADGTLGELINQSLLQNIRQELIDLIEDIRTQTNKDMNDIFDDLMESLNQSEQRIEDNLKEKTEEIEVIRNHMMSRIDEHEWNTKHLGLLTNSNESQSSVLQNIVDNYTGKIFVPAGNYVFNEGVIVKKSGVQLEFSKNAKVTTSYAGTSRGFLTFEGSISNTVFHPLENINTGSNGIEVSYVPNDLKVGDWVKVYSSQLYHPARNDYTNREYKKIKEINDNVITFDDVMFYSYNHSSHPVTIRKINLLENVSVSGLNLTHVGEGSIRGINFKLCYNPKIYENRVFNFQYSNIETEECLYPEIEHNEVGNKDVNNGLSYGIFINSCAFSKVFGNTGMSYRTFIDVTYMSYDTIVFDNTAHKGNINTHGCRVFNISNNIINNGSILLRGTEGIVNANNIRTGFTSPSGGNIFFEEMAEYGDLVITNNVLSTFTNAQSANGIYCGIKNTQNIIISGNKITSQINGISLYLGADTDTTIKNIMISNNDIEVFRNGIDGSRSEMVSVIGNRIRAIQIVDNSVGITFFSSSQPLKGVVISNNTVDRFNRPLRVWATYDGCVVMGNIASFSRYTIASQVNSTNTETIGNVDSNMI